jgi:hypothetical protein
MKELGSKKTSLKERIKDDLKFFCIIIERGIMLIIWNENSFIIEGKT